MKEYSDSLSALLVQTSIYPEFKLPFNGSEPLSPDMQWGRIFSMLYPYIETKPDLIILPEAALPYGTHLPIYPLEVVEHVFKTFFENKASLPTSTQPYVGNAYWVQGLANVFSADVVIGLEDFEMNKAGKVDKAYNAAFLAHPFSNTLERYEKRVLVPMGEFIPFNWCRSFLAKYGIEDSFTPGKEAKVFETSQGIPISISICYEETYGHLMRENRRKGASLLVNVTNDVWYPRSRLPMVHFLHGRLRAIEAGMPLLRACNTGVTCGVDSLGRLVGMLTYESSREYSSAEALELSLPLYHYPTFYTRFGDLPIILLSSVCFGFLCFGKFSKRKAFYVNDLEVSPLRKN